MFTLHLCYPQEGDLFALGQYVAISNVQGAGGFPFLSESVYNYFTAGVALGIAVENLDIIVGTLRFVVNKVIVVLTAASM